MTRPAGSDRWRSTGSPRTRSAPDTARLRWRRQFVSIKETQTVICTETWAPAGCFPGELGEMVSRGPKGLAEAGVVLGRGCEPPPHQLGGLGSRGVDHGGLRGSGPPPPWKYVGGQSMFWPPPENVTFFHSKLVFYNFKFHNIKDE